MNRTVVVTGAAGGLGGLMCRQLLAQGDTVVGLDVSQQGLEALRESVDAPERLHVWALDITDRAACEEVGAAALAATGGVDWIIHNAGITQLDAFADTDPTVFERVMGINVLGVAYLTHVFLPSIRQRQGVVVGISSVAGIAPLVRRTAYSASKHALHGFLGSLRTELVDDNVHVMLVCPSFIRTNPGAAGDASGTARPGSAADAPKEQLEPDEVVRAILQAAAQRNKRLLLLGKAAYAGYWLSRILPAVYDRLMLKTVKQ